jgi:hypothetical protein
MILPGTGRWQPVGSTEGRMTLTQRPLHHFVVPLPVPGRIA